MEIFNRALTYDDVCLVPQYNNIPSRTEPDLKTWLTSRTEIGLPVVPANMDTVIGDDLADAIIKNNGIPIFHRFTTFEQRMTWAKKYGDRCYMSCGLNNIDETVSLLTETECRGVCIDIAHAHSETMKNFMLELRKRVGNDKEIIAGNVCTPMGYQDLVNWGADAVKVGIGGGCLGEDSDILMGDGSLKKIKNIKVGDFVVNRYGEKVRVNAVVCMGKKRTVDIVKNGRSLHLTPDHRVLINNDWIEIFDVLDEDIKKNYSDTIKIDKNLSDPMDVYDIEVDCESHSFIAEGVTVHNSICTTRKVTGFGTPQFSAVYECGLIARKLRIPIIADGGIRGTDDIAKALAAGASSVMCGSMFSNTFESSAPKFEKDGKTYMKYRGQASKDFQTDFYGDVKKGTVPEGVHFDREVTKSAQEVIDDITGGLRSSFTYGGARNIKEFQRKAEFRTVNQSYIAESNPRPHQ